MTRRTRITLAASALVATTSLSGVQAAQVIATDLVVQGSICAGLDCVNGESFGFDTLRLKENNLRIKFQDTSNSASFPSNDWSIEANDSTNGGVNYLRFLDVDGGRAPFTVEAGAQANTLYVEADGDVGIKTSEPVVDLHIVEGNTPTVRLEQDGSDGFTPQTYDVAANEANFFIRDVTNGSKLFFRAKPGAPEDSIFIAANGKVGLGFDNPAHQLHVATTGSVVTAVESLSDNPIQIRLISDSDNRRIAARNGADNASLTQIMMRDDHIEFTGADTTLNIWARVDANGIQLPAGAAFTVNGTNLAVPDYVFAPDYELMPLTDVRAFIAENSHLPEVPSAAEINTSVLNIPEMQLTLLRKVEELTLYTLEQQALIDQLQTKVETLSAQ